MAEWFEYINSLFIVAFSLGDFPCKYFYTRHMCYHGDKCKFSHAPLNQESYEILMSVSTESATSGVNSFFIYMHDI